MISWLGIVTLVDNPIFTSSRRKVSTIMTNITDDFFVINVRCDVLWNAYRCLCWKPTTFSCKCVWKWVADTLSQGAFIEVRLLQQLHWICERGLPWFTYSSFGEERSQGYTSCGPSFSQDKRLLRDGEVVRSRDIHRLRATFETKPATFWPSKPLYVRLYNYCILLKTKWYANDWFVCVVILNVFEWPCLWGTIHLCGSARQPCRVIKPKSLDGIKKFSVIESTF